MTDERWLRDALRGATSYQPVVGDLRANGALRIAATRKRRRLAGASAAVVVAVFVATSLTGGSTRGLDPVSPTQSPNASETPYAGDPSATPEPTPVVEPTAETGGSPAPSAGPEESPEPAEGERWVVYCCERRKPIEVYFLVDQSGDMSPFRVAEVTGAIVKRMRARGNHVRYGYGLFRDIPQPQYELLTPVYERIAQIGDSPQWTGKAAAGGDTPDADTIGLMAATGWTDALHVRESRPAGFSPDATKLIVLITNAPVKQGSGYPTIAETVESLQNEDIAVASVLVDPVGAEGEDMAVRDLTTISEGTHARAAGLVDCDGDGRYTSEVDLHPGAVFLCRRTMGGDWRGIADGLVALGRARD